MASQARRGGVSLPERRNPRGRDAAETSIISRITNSEMVVRGREAASEASVVAKKLMKSTGKAAWILGTTFLVLAVPLIIEMDRDQQMSDLELQQASLLGTSSQK